MDGDPIVALATPPGRSAIAVLRVSGRGCAQVLTQLTGRRTFEPRRATLVDVRLGDDFSDRAVATWMPAPRSFTGEDSFEIALHGSPVVAAAAMEMLARHGVRRADRGEFTARAFLNGKLDLVEAEAVDDLIRSTTPAQARVASAQVHGALSAPLAEIGASLVEVLERLEASLDFPDEGYHFIDPDDLRTRLHDLDARCAALAGAARAGRLLREGATVVIAGRPNVGKSSLFNALAGSARAIVTDVPGTTRDVLVDTVDIAGVPVTLVDTAGLRESGDVVEREGVARARASAADADLVVVVVDASDDAQGSGEADAQVWAAHAAQPRLLVMNKQDRRAGASATPAWAAPAKPCCVSARTGEGIARLRTRVGDALGAVPWEATLVTNGRHLGLLDRTRTALGRAMVAVDGGATEEYVAVDVRDALLALDEIRGRVTAEEVLHGIFSRFCIGK